MPMHQSPLELARIQASIPISPSLSKMLSFSFAPCKGKALSKEIADLFPHGATLSSLEETFSSPHPKPSKKLKVAVVFSGGQAPGGHNVIAGIWDGLSEIGEGSELYGFLGGPSGILSGKYKKLSSSDIAPFRNTGGFDLLGSGRTKIETEEQFENALKVCKELELDGLVVIGGDDSNTNAALLSEYFYKKGCSTCVVGIPKTIDGDLKNSAVPISFGFDTASKVYAELIGNLARDALSARKYYHFVRLMGRTASHLALECALLTHPNYTLIAEEVYEKKMTLKQIVDDLVSFIVKRSSLGKSYGVILIPEGLIEWIPEVATLIQELNAILAKESAPSKEEIQKRLTPKSQECFAQIPSMIQNQLLLVRDPHGNVQVSLIETERLLAEMISQAMKKHENVSFHPLPHFFGYEGRSAYPSNFDASYCYCLGKLASLAVFSSLSGYMCCISNLHKPVKEWKCSVVPLASQIHLEERKGKLKPVIAKALVDLKAKPFKTFVEQRESWKLDDCYSFPGPMQFQAEIAPPLTLLLENP